MTLLDTTLLTQLLQNQISDEGAIDLANALQSKHCNLTSLNLSNNEIQQVINSVNKFAI